MKDIGELIVYGAPWCGDCVRSEALLDRLKIKYEKMHMNDKVSKISIVGSGMVATPGITFKMFRSLADANINLLATNPIVIPNPRTQALAQALQGRK